MEHVEHIENARLILQAQLDGGKTQLERNRLGQFATPSALASDILYHAKTLLSKSGKVRFFDPAIGTGAFYAALLRHFSKTRIQSAFGFEIDRHYADDAKVLWSDTSLDIRIEDFTKACPPITDAEKANLVICNPPYVRHHHLSGDDKKRLQQAALEVGASLNGLTGLYCYFLALSIRWMTPGALAGWLIPSEFMDVNYGVPLKKFLLDRVNLLHIHRFNPDAVQFDDALVSSAVVWFRNESPEKNAEVLFTFGASMDTPERAATVPAETLRHSRKWTHFPTLQEKELSTGQHVRLGDLFHIKRGLATGANNYFVLTEAQAQEHQLPRDVLVPILPSPRDVKVTDILADSVGDPMLPTKLYLFSSNLPEPELKATYPSAWEYVQLGMTQGIHDGYLCRHRTPWYTQEDRPAPRFLCTYMGRNGNAGRSIFRFIRNRSNATAANVYLLLYPKPFLRVLLDQFGDLEDELWKLLSEISPDSLLSEGRVYGGGLHKLEPRELANAPLPHTPQIIKNALTPKIAQLQFLTT